MTKFVAVDEVTGDVAEVEDEAGKWKSDAMMLVGARWSGQRGGELRPYQLSALT